MPSSLLFFLCAAFSAISLVGDGRTVSAAAPGAERASQQSAAAAPQSRKKVAQQNSRNRRTAIKHAMRMPIRLDAVGTPLAKLADSFREQTGIDICLDEQELKEAGVKSDTPITLRVSGLPFKSVLALVLDPLHLGWTIDNGVLLITSVAASYPQSLTMKTYDVADLVACRDRKGNLWDDYDALTGMITETVEPASWSHNGGQASILGATFGTAKVLVVVQSPDGHRDIGRLLKTIRKIAAKKSGGDALPRRDKPQALPTSPAQRHYDESAAQRPQPATGFKVAARPPLGGAGHATMVE